MVVLGALAAARLGAASGAAARHLRITIAVMPHGTTPEQLAQIDGMAVGLLSAGLGSVPPAQTMIDLGQGARLNESLYDEALAAPVRRSRLGGRPPRVPAALWQRVRDRAEAAPADLVPGLLGTTLKQGHVATDADQASGLAPTILVDRTGVVPGRRQCRQDACARVSAVSAHLGRLRAIARRLHGGDLVIAIERPPPGPGSPARDRRGGSGLRVAPSARIRRECAATCSPPTSHPRSSSTWGSRSPTR